MKQKFRKLEFVQIGDKTAIIDGSYSQIHGGHDIESYQVYILSDNPIVVTNKKAWFHEKQITKIDPDLQNPQFAEELIENYNLRFK
jgi:hypothetical protein